MCMSHESGWCVCPGRWGFPALAPLLDPHSERLTEGAQTRGPLLGIPSYPGEDSRLPSRHTPIYHRVLPEGSKSPGRHP